MTNLPDFIPQYKLFGWNWTLSTDCLVETHPSVQTVRFKLIPQYRMFGWNSSLSTHCLVETYSSVQTGRNSSLSTDCLVETHPSVKTVWLKLIPQYRLFGWNSSLSTDWLVETYPSVQTGWLKIIPQYRLFGWNSSPSTDWLVDIHPSVQTVEIHPVQTVRTHSSVLFGRSAIPFHIIWDAACARPRRVSFKQVECSRLPWQNRE